MRLANQDIETLTTALARQLAHARTAYAAALDLINAPQSSGQLMPLFRRGTYGDESRIEAVPYVPVVPGVAFGFEDKRQKVTVSLQPVASEITDDPDACDCEITLTEGALSDWISLELEIGLQHLRPSCMVRVSLFGVAEIPDEAYEQDKCHVDMFCFDTDGKRHRLTSGNIPFVIPQSFGHTRADFWAALPASPRIDESRPASLVIFFSPQAERIVITDFSVSFD